MASCGDKRHNDSVELLRQLSRQSSDGTECSVTEELELLQNVYLQEELEIISAQKGPVVLKFHVTPSTANDKNKQFVYVDVIISLSHEYPLNLPDVIIKESRGVSDAHLQSISDGVRHLSVEHQGSPMIYDLVEFVKDCLTDNNRPCGQCAICQLNFQEDDEFVRTDCYHYYHPPCLLRYMKFCEQQTSEEGEKKTGNNRQTEGESKPLECPVCRAPVLCSSALLTDATSEEDENDLSSSFERSPELIQWQREMAVLYKRQLDRGGIVVTSEQDDTIDETWVSARRKLNQDERKGKKEEEEEKEKEGIIVLQKSKKEKEGPPPTRSNRHKHYQQRRRPINKTSANSSIHDGDSKPQLTSDGSINPSQKRPPRYDHNKHHRQHAINDQSKHRHHHSRLPTNHEETPTTQTVDSVGGCISDVATTGDNLAYGASSSCTHQRPQSRKWERAWPFDKPVDSQEDHGGVTSRRRERRKNHSFQQQTNSRVEPDQQPTIATSKQLSAADEPKDSVQVAMFAKLDKDGPTHQITCCPHSILASECESASNGQACDHVQLSSHAHTLHGPRGKSAGTGNRSHRRTKNIVINIGSGSRQTGAHAHSSQGKKPRSHSNN